MNQEEQYHELNRDEVADYHHQQLMEEWQYADHAKTIAESKNETAQENTV